jgi:dihydrofolate synthase/folylpolyglutamate synthase
VEVFTGEQTIVVDTAHNLASAQALVSALEELPAPARRSLVLSVSRDKDVRAIVGTLAPHFDRFVVTQYQENPRAVRAESLAEILRGALAGRAVELAVCPNPPDAWQFIQRSVVPRELVCITGSFFLAAEMRRLIDTR